LRRGERIASSVSERSVNVHKEARAACADAFKDFMDEVYRAMSGEERDSLPNAVGPYVHAIVGHALGALPVFGEALAQTIADVHSQTPQGERFIQDPTRSDEIGDFALFLDEDGQLVSVCSPVLTRTRADGDDYWGILEMTGYQSYEVLTGPLAGRRFNASSRPLPSEPVYRPGAVLHAGSLTGATHEDAGERSDRGRVFLCHASEDKLAVRALYERLKASGFQPWLDEEDLLPGQDWDREIARAVRSAQVVLVCLSKRSEKRGYVQKEIRRALDVAEEQPEGTIFLIPVKLEDCAVPDRLAAWQWVDLHSERGYHKLEAALGAAVGAVQGNAPANAQGHSST
jgi:TIR domain